MFMNKIKIKEVLILDKYQVLSDIIETDNIKG